MEHMTNYFISIWF